MRKVKWKYRSDCFFSCFFVCVWGGGSTLSSCPGEQVLRQSKDFQRPQMGSSVWRKNFPYMEFVDRQ